MSGPCDVDELMSTYNREQRHIDSHLSHLSSAEQQLKDLTLQQERRQEDLYSTLEAWDVKQADREATLKRLERKLNALESEKVAGSDALATLQLEQINQVKTRKDLERQWKDLDLGPHSQLLRVALGDSTVWKGEYTPRALADALALKEDSLRVLEQQLLNLQRDLQARQLELVTVQREKGFVEAELEAESNRRRKRLADLQQRAEALRSEIDLLRQSSGACDRVTAEEDERRRIEAEITALKATRDDLQKQISNATQERRVQEEEIMQKLRVLTLAGDSHEARAKMDETMMLLKSQVINLHTDYSMIGDMRADAKRFDGPQREDLFSAAYNDTREVVAEMYGIDLPEEGQWSFTSIDLPPTTATKLHQLVSALKRMVINYDMLPTRLKPQMKTSATVIENSYSLYTIAKQAMSRQKQVEEDRCQLRAARQSQKSAAGQRGTPTAGSPRTDVYGGGGPSPGASEPPGHPHHPAGVRRHLFSGPAGGGGKPPDAPLMGGAGVPPHAVRPVGGPGGGGQAPGGPSQAVNGGASKGYNEPLPGRGVPARPIQRTAAKIVTTPIARTAK